MVVVEVEVSLVRVSVIVMTSMIVEDEVIVNKRMLVEVEVHGCQCASTATVEVSAAGFATVVVVAARTDAGRVEVETLDRVSHSQLFTHSQPYFT